MELYEYTGDERIEAPDRRDLREMRVSGEKHELVVDLLRWKGSATRSYFDEIWNLEPQEVSEIAESMEEEGQVDIEYD